MDYDILKFSYNWNKKLNCNYFTTLRLKQAKYKIGNKYRLLLKDNHLKDVEIVNIKELNINDINVYIAGLDTGYNIEETKNILKSMYKTTNFNTQLLYLILLKTINQNT